MSIVVRNKRIDISRKSLLDSKKYVLVANHASMLDPFLIGSSFAYRVHKRLGPYRFFITNRMFNKWWLTFWLFSFGGFPAKWHPRYKYGLSYASDLLRNGQSVMIFPEGRVSKRDKMFQPKKGVEMLANLKDVELIPARIKWNRRKGFIKGFSMSVGKPFDGKNMTAEQIMDVVYSLKFR